MKLEEKFNLIFASGYTIQFQNQIKRKDGDWHNRIVWKQKQPSGQHITECEWFGFENINDCVDDCLKHINSLK